MLQDVVHASAEQDYSKFGMERADGWGSWSVRDTMIEEESLGRFNVFALIRGTEISREFQTHFMTA